MARVSMLANYARTMRVRAVIEYPQSVVDVQRMLGNARRSSRPVCLQGAALSYGDSALPLDEGVVISLTKMNRVLETNFAEKWVRVEAGVSLGEILSRSLPHRLILPVVPGEHRVTV